MRQRTHLTGHHGKAAAGFAGTRRFDRRVERQDIRLKRQAVDHADDFVHAFGPGLNRFHRSNRLRHRGGTAFRHVTHLHRTGIGLGRGRRVVMYGAGELFHAGSGFFQIGSLLLSAIRQFPVASGHALARVRDKGRVAADIGHHR